MTERDPKLEELESAAKDSKWVNVLLDSLKGRCIDSPERDMAMKMADARSILNDVAIMTVRNLVDQVQQQASTVPCPTCKAVDRMMAESFPNERRDPLDKGFCPDCHGSGRVPKPVMVPCGVCDGSGQRAFVPTNDAVGSDFVCPADCTDGQVTFAKRCRQERIAELEDIAIPVAAVSGVADRVVCRRIAELKEADHDD